jgi:hypothetical protein
MKSKAKQTLGQPYRIKIQCSCTAIMKSKSTGEHNKLPKGINCPFRASIRHEGSAKVSFVDSWRIEINKNSHNHTLNQDLNGDDTARRTLRTALAGKIENTVERLSAITTMTSH